MENNSMLMVERYRRQLYRIGWRLQYQARKIRNHECMLLEGVPMRQQGYDAIDTRLALQQYLRALPHRGQLILYKLYMQQLTEAEVAAQLQISQQAVSKWKQKMLKQLYRTVNLQD